ncbi:Uncharacterized conserved protein YndB, AHSA1/START domain [Amycolatopsis marina]|uniref:Uncharacterized conserved protein YndB, AHSA1/START domain n=1 Tax=Amycolatopsis marina TaxID=490629 RepID=A0A1I1BQ77_9PSEU|nr:SRPBCC domain-containing protein [Amycolatopsis marina]SFB52441.1 Uncharacterized conserved protein YndB, AHSA1/START domain [Amycolatopsis marina]
MVGDVDPDRILTIERVFAAPRDLVFRAWTDPGQLARWWGPKGFTAPSVTANVTEGGRWRTCIRSAADGVEYWAQGVYREIVEPERLKFTFAWDADDGTPGNETLITVTFTEQDDNTLMDFRQEGLLSAEDRDSHHGGWSECFDDLTAHLSRER